jgi:hypothetical protein
LLETVREKTVRVVKLVDANLDPESLLIADESVLFDDGDDDTGNGILDTSRWKYGKTREGIIQI